MMNVETSRPSITFVCCVESGFLEAQTIRMVESLRRWGGCFADLPVFAVTPRFGVALAQETHKAFERLEVNHICFRSRSKYAWNKFMNKPQALVAVEGRVSTEFIGWLDSDLLFLKEPDDLCLRKHEDIAARVATNGGTTGDGDPQEPFWREVCKLFDLETDELPWVTNYNRRRIRLYFNSGVFVYRNLMRFANYYLETCTRLLDAHIANRSSGIFFHDQVALAISIAKMKLSWRCLSYSHNHGMSPTNLGVSFVDELEDARILHYHNFMDSKHWEQLLNYLMVNRHHSVAEWLSLTGSPKDSAPVHVRSIRRMLKFMRHSQESLYIRSCKTI